MPVKYNIISPRDIKQQSNDRFDYKLDRRQPIRAVICDEFGNDSGSGDIWYDQSKRRVWIRELGTSSASIVFCYSLTPVIGLGVLVGWRPYSNVKEVLSSDIEFLGQTNATGTSYESPSNVDFLPGGRLQLWLQSKLIQPLATYPSTSGLVVNVVGGDYIYNGQRVTFAGQTNIDLSASQPAAGDYVFVGLYLDSANTLQTIAGASGATTPPAEPAWPDGAFRLSVVRLYNPQTKVNLKLDTDADNDIFDRRIIWTDVDSFDIWPYDKILTVSPTNAFANFTTIQDAIDYQELNTLQDVIILCDPAIYTETLTFTLGSVCLASLGVNGEVVITSTDAITITINAANVTLKNITIDNTETGTNGTGVQIAANRDGTIFDNCRFSVTNATVTNAYAVDVNGGDQMGTLFRECTFYLDAGATLNTAIDVATDCIINLEDGQIESLGGTNYAINAASGAIIRLSNPKLISGSLNGAGSFGGSYFDSSGNTIVINGNYVYGNISGTGRPNPLVNGAFLVWQRGTSFAAAADNTYTADRWVYRKSGAMVHTVSQSSDVPTVSQAGILTPYSLLIDCTTVDSSIAAGDFCVLNHWMEGFNFLDLAQRQFTLSFWVKATKTGVYCVAFRNAGGNRSWVAEYTVNTTATWEFKTITVSASPSAGTWDYTTGIGLGVTFSLAGGSTFQTTAGAWQTGNFTATANQVNACDSTSNDFRLALINISPGPIAPSPRLPDYQAEFARCQRYAWVLEPSNVLNQGQGAKVSTTIISILLPHPVQMRTAPALSHNITGYTSGVPGTTTIGIIDYARNVFYAITGALTVGIGSGGTNVGVNFTNLAFTAGTSWDGTAGNLSALRLGPSVVLVLSADF